MRIIIVATVVLNVLGQRSFDLLGKRDYEYVDYHHQRSPYQSGQYNDKKSLKQKPLLIDETSLFEELGDKLEKYNKYEEFQKFSAQIRERSRADPKRTFQDELNEIYQWLKKLERQPIYTSEPQLQNIELPRSKPNPGMSQYWAQPEQEKQHFFPNPNNKRKLTGAEVMNLALRKLESIDAIDKKSPMEKFPEVMKSLPDNLPTDLLQDPINKLSNYQLTTIAPNILPEVDDYKSPVRWVSLDSNDTRDGLAKVTDPRTGRNQQFFINQTIFVPVIDYRIERLGLTTTTHRPVLTTDKRALRTVQQNVDFKNVDERDWLAFETVLGERNESNRCDGENCQSRCKTLACESVCTGDTCKSGCIGGFCNTFCKGPGCLSMCIGESCTAKCDGMACDARCRGNGCESSCNTFSCTYTINGQTARGGGSWDDHYHDYVDKNMKYTQYG